LIGLFCKQKLVVFNLGAVMVARSQGRGNRRA